MIAPEPVIDLPPEPEPAAPDTSVDPTTDATVAPGVGEDAAADGSNTAWVSDDAATPYVSPAPYLDGGVLAHETDAGGLRCRDVLEVLGDYVDGELDPANALAVEHLIATDAALGAEVERVGIVDEADRLNREQRRGQDPSASAEQPTVLLVIDRETAALPHWRGLDPDPLASADPYRLWRLDRRRLEARAASLNSAGISADWQRPRPERY